jgi:hypothetical protein
VSLIKKTWPNWVLPGISRFPDKMWQGHITRDSQESSSLTRYLWYFAFQLEVYSIQLYVIKFVKGLRQVGHFLRVLWFSPSIKLPRYNWNIVESGVNPWNKQTKKHSTRLGWKDKRCSKDANKQNKNLNLQFSTRIFCNNTHCPLIKTSIEL